MLPSMPQPCRLPGSFRRRILPRAAAASVLLLLGARSAHAECPKRQPSIEFTFPSEATESVPPDAVFWVVSPAGEARAWIDDVPLTPLGTDLVERHQFKYPELLSEGEHELVARAGNDARRVVPFRVAAAPTASANVGIDAVDVYPLTQGASGWVESPGYDTTWCPIVPLGDYCNDIIPESVAVARYSSEGDAIALLAQGGWLVTPECGMFSTSTWSSDPSSFRVAAVLPSGVGEESTYSGTIEAHSAPSAHPALYDGPDDRCSIGFGERSPGSLASVGLALVAWLARRRRLSR
jgi:hypothetical protein